MITVLGSMNVDFVTMVGSIPRPGETILSPSYEAIPGGKGANQALAAARAGAKVRMIGAAGRDASAEPAQRLLRAAGVDLSGVATVDAPTGAAFIAVDPTGENAIVVASGANARVSAAGLDKVRLGDGDILLLQREIPAAEVLAGARLAKGSGACVILNAAPSGGFDAGILEFVDILIINEHEALDVARALAWSETTPDAIARRLSAERGLVAIVTLGGEGVIGWGDGVRKSLAAAKVEVVDTTGAGDAFCGVFSAALDRGLDWAEALRFGVAGGGLACLKPGAQPGLPSRDEIETLAATLSVS